MAAAHSASSSDTGTDSNIAAPHASASAIGQSYRDVGETETVRWYQTAFGQHLVAA
jgi:hypothetical protein